MNSKNIFGAFSLGIALFFFWPAVYGSWQEVSALRQAVSDRQQLLDTRTDILSKASDEYKKYQAALAGVGGQNFAQLVPVRKNAAELVSAAQDIAQTSGVQISQIQITELKGNPGDAYKTLTMSLEMTGSYAGLRTFLTDLENYVRILNVNSIQISADPTGGLRYIIKADSYFLK
jgi:Tfp pilus assembly protein PilO